jgi:hypothetical protein
MFVHEVSMGQVKKEVSATREEKRSPAEYEGYVVVRAAKWVDSKGVDEGWIWCAA